MRSPNPNCKQCEGCGWRSTEGKGYPGLAGVEICPCVDEYVNFFGQFDPEIHIVTARDVMLILDDERYIELEKKVCEKPSGGLGFVIDTFGLIISLLFLAMFLIWLVLKAAEWWGQGL